MLVLLFNFRIGTPHVQGLQHNARVVQADYNVFCTMRDIAQAATKQDNAYLFTKESEEPHVRNNRIKFAE